MIVWSGVGIILVIFASDWLAFVHSRTVIFLLILIGLLLASGIYFFGFSKLASRNVQRIIKIHKERAYLFGEEK